METCLWEISMDTSKRTKELPMTVPDESLMVNETPKRLNQSQIAERKENTCCDEQHGCLSCNDVSIFYVSLCIVDYSLI